MSYNGSGVYTLPGAQLANGATVSATENNQFRNDVAAALNVAWTRDGQAPATNDIPMGSNKLTELAQPTTEGDALAFGKNATVDDLAVTGNQTVTGNSDVTGNQAVGGNLTVTGTASLGGEYLTPYTGFKNFIINGAMMIDQRNGGASVTPTNGQYTLDRWRATLTQNSKYTVQQNAGSVAAPAGSINYLGITSSSAYSVTSNDTFYLSQLIEGYNVADFSWGTASAATITISFKVYSSLTGTFGGSVIHASGTRSYPFSYTVSSANTWTSVSVTIPGDTSGTWTYGNNANMIVAFGLGSGSTYTAAAGSWAAGSYVQPAGTVSVVGTNGATFYITGVQLEKGSTATSFDYRPYGTELALCQRYYETGSIGMDGYGDTSNAVGSTIAFAVTKRATPTTSFVSISYFNCSGLTSQNFNNGLRATANVTATGAAGFATAWTASSEL